MLERSRHDVRRECAIRGLNCAVPRSALVECPECRRHRTRLDPSRGLCRVCLCRAATERTETRAALELAAAPASIRGRFGDYAKRIGPRKPPPPRPRPPRTDGMTAAQRVRAADAHDVAVERWELAVADREYNAARQRLHRLRVALAEETRRTR